MELKDLHYDAFISYRHCELDMFVAKNLHKYLESFTVPKSVRKLHPGMKTKVSRVFRDQEELPLVSNLGDPITEALKNSDNLIVICTPRLKESQWCKKEIETFIKMHGRRNVFAVLAEGEPEDSFPEELMVDENGIPCEPLAANFRGSSYREIKKNMQVEGLRLLAPIFGLNFDDLKQRHRERKLRRIITLGSIIMALVLGIASYSTVTALKIKHQSDEIAAQNVEISKQNVEISKQAEEIEIQYKESLKKYEISMANASEGLMREGRRKEAIYALYNAMPKTTDDTSVPLVTEAQKAITDVLGAYSTGDLFTPLYNYEVGSTIDNLVVSPTGRRIAMHDASMNVSIWNTEENTLIRNEYAGSYSYTNSGIEFIDDDHLLMYDDDGEFILDVNTGDRVYVLSHEGKIKFSADRSLVLIASTDMVIYDTATLEEVFRLEGSNDFLNSTMFDEGAISEDNSKFAALMSSDIYSETPTAELNVYDIKSGELISSVHIGTGEDIYTALCYGGDTVYIAAGSTSNLVEYTGIVIAVDVENEEIAWVNTVLDSLLYDMRFVDTGMDRYLYAHDSYGPYTLSADDGSLIYHAGSSYTIVDSRMLNDPRFELLTCSDGTLIRYIIDTGYALDSSMYTYDIKGDVVNAKFASARLYLVMRGNNYVTHYGFIHNDYINELAKVESHNYDYTAPDLSIGADFGSSADGARICSVYDVETSELIDEFETTCYSLNYVDGGSEGFVLASSWHIEYYDVKKKELKVIAEEDDILNLMFESSHGYGHMFGYTQSPDLDHRYFGAINALTGEDTGIKIDIKDNRFASYDVAPDGSSAVLLDPTNSTMGVYVPGDDKPKLSPDLRYGVPNKALYSDDSKYIFLFYKNGTVQIFDAAEFKEVKVLFTDDNMAYGVYKIDATGGYAIRGSQGILLNDEFDEIATLNDLTGYNKEKGMLMFRDSTGYYECPILSYDEIMKKAGDEIANFVPDERLLNKYGISQ